MGTSSSKTGRAGGAPNSSFKRIADNYTTLEQVQAALRRNGLESSNLIVAIDYTKSNEWTGKQCFHNRSLHALGPEPNPYEIAISIIAKTLQAFDDDGLIPAIGFGDSTTGDLSVFNFFHNNAPARGLQELVSRYRELTPYVKLAGPTSFAPAIYEAMKIVVQSGGQFHILVIVADGQVTRPSDMAKRQLSRQEQATVDAIVAASRLPLSIILVGVGDGPWDVMQEFDDKLPSRSFDNFQFVNFTDTFLRHGRNPSMLEAKFALAALMEIPEQFKIIQRLGLLGARVRMESNVRCLPPPGPLPGAYPQPAYGAPSPGPHYGNPAPAAPSFGGPPPPPNFGGLPPMPAGAYAALPVQPPPGPFGPASMQHGQAQLPYSATRGPPDAAASAAPAAGGSDPSLFTCPISQEIMSDPVIAADGYTYERSAIARWLQTHDTSPMSNARLAHKELIPNHTLRSSIMEYTEARAACRA